MNKEHYIKQIKELAKYLENKAEDIANDIEIEMIRNIYITTLIEPNSVPTWNISKEYYVMDFIENKKQALKNLKKERESE